jgi:hypothetical protein
MATKKAQPKAQPKAAAAPASNTASNDMGAMWKWLYVAGVVVASLAAALNFRGAEPYLGWVLILIGILVGAFYFDSADLMNFGLRYLILLAVAAAAPLNSVPVVGEYITGFFNGFATFLGPIVLTMIVMFFWKKYFGSK